MKYNEFKAKFFNGSTNKLALIESLKAVNINFSALNKLIARFENENSQFKSLVKQAFLGRRNNPLSYKDLNKERPLYYTGSIEKEISWEAISVIREKKLINEFIIQRNQFESALLLGDYEQARSLLDTIENNISVSHWSIENRLILDEYQFGSEKNWETRNALLDDNNANLVHVIGDFYSVKSESKYSFFQFNDYYDGWEALHKNSINELPDRYKNYFRFKVNYFSQKSHSSYSDILYTESNSSIIDRYIMLVKVIQHIVLTYEEKDNYLVPVLRCIETNIDDLQITQILLMIDTPCNLVTDDDVLRIIDLYTNGNYLESCIQSKLYLSNSRSDVFELYEIFAKSLVEQNLPFERVTEKESIANSVAKIYYDLYNKNDNVDNALLELIKLSYVFNNSHIGLHLYSMVADQLNWKIEIDYGFLKRLNSKIINPGLYNYIYKDTSVAKRYLDNIMQMFGASPTVSLLMNFNESIQIGVGEVYTNIPEVKAKIYQGRSSLIKLDYEGCIRIYGDLMKNYELSPIAWYEIFSNLFICYLKLRDYKECLTIFVDAYIKNPHFIKRMDGNSLSDIILKGKFKNLQVDKFLVELPIFFKILGGEKIRIKQAYELFLKSNDCSRPSEFLDKQDHITSDKLIYFLRNVCIPDILQLSKYMESTYKVNVERIRICQNLALLDHKNLLTYNHEIAFITQKNAISKVIGRIDEGKIYVNDEKIKAKFLRPGLKTEASKLNSTVADGYLTREYFYRTVDLQKFTEHKEYKQSTTVFYADYDNEGNVKFKNNPVYDSFRTMFLEVRDNFVSNNEFGLDAYLSTRIRHGTLPNHIRSVFERLNLVTAQTDGVYGNNDYWEERLSLSGDRNKKIQGLLAEFSKKIDELSTVLKEEWIQSKTEKTNEKPHALFDYSYKNDYDLLVLFMSKVDDYEDFINQCFTTLWERTDKCLEVIKSKLHKETKPQFVALITELEQELDDLANKNDLYELKNNVTLSRTEIQTLLSNIIKWFKRSESSYDGEYELKMLADTSIQITKNINPTYNFEIDPDVEVEIAVKGEYHQHIIDIIRNFLENMIKRSDLTIERLEPFLRIEKESNNIYFVFENNIAPALDKTDLINKLKVVKDGWMISDDNISKENGTGFPKIKKILHYDLDRRKSHFDFLLVENRLKLTLSFETLGLEYENTYN